MSIWNPSPELHKSLMAELGLCLFLYQSIEVSLKALLPHFALPGTDTPVRGEGFENWRIFLDSRLTLGPMMEKFKERMTFSDPAAMNEELRRLVDYRNEVAHSFVGQPFARLATEEDYKAAFAFLNKRRVAALPMYELLQAMLADALAAWAQIPRAGGASAA